MQIRWSPGSAQDLEQIFDYVRTDNTAAAQRVGQTICALPNVLATCLYLGRRGRVDGTRKLPMPPLPFIIVYRVLEHVHAVEVVNVIHGAQRWPPLTKE